MLIQPVLRPVLQPVLRSIFDPGIGGGGGTSVWTPARLFENGEQGALYYFTDDFAGLYQDAAGTTPVTAVGQPVGRILDRSGNGNHATQADASKKPILQSIGGKLALVFDGVDDFLSTGSIDFTSTDKMTVVAGVRKLSDAAAGCVVELTSSFSATDGGVGLFAPFGAGANYGGGHRASVAIQWSFVTFTSPRTDVVSQINDMAAPVGRIRVNGVQAGQSTLSPGAGNFANSILYIGRRNGSTLPFNGHLYQLVVRGALTADLAPVETYVADKAGVTLP